MYRCSMIRCTRRPVRLRISQDTNSTFNPSFFPSTSHHPKSSVSHSSSPALCAQSWAQSNVFLIVAPTCACSGRNHEVAPSAKAGQCDCGGAASLSKLDTEVHFELQAKNILQHGHFIDSRNISVSSTRLDLLFVQP
jgi:hypothetical protein